MKRSRREQAMHALSILFAVAPFAFGLFRFFATRSDLRLMWMAFASFLGAVLVRAIARRRGRQRNVLLRLSAATLVVATLLAAATAYLLGATAAAGVWLVAFVLALCWAASSAFDTLSRPPAV
jgi:hypothetical protein